MTLILLRFKNIPDRNKRRWEISLISVEGGAVQSLKDKKIMYAEPSSLKINSKSGSVSNSSFDRHNATMSRIKKLTNKPYKNGTERRNPR